VSCNFIHRWVDLLKGNGDLDNLFNFCHLGVEIFLKSAPYPCEMEGHDRLLPKPEIIAVEFKSDFNQEKIRAMRQEAVIHGTTVKKLFLVAQYIPFLGRLAAHATVNYWV
jgi:hypothetical protein